MCASSRHAPGVHPDPSLSALPSEVFHTLDPKPSPFPWAVFAVVAALAAALRLAALGQEALFLDEYLTLRTSTVPGGFRDFLRYVWLHDPHPPLYFLMMRTWTAVAGDSHVALRLPSALAGIAAVWAIMRALFETRRAGPFACALIGVLAAANPFLVYYSQEARAYSLLVLLVALNTVFLVRLWVYEDQTPRAGDLLGMAATALLAAAVHYFAIFLVAQDLAVLILRQVTGQDGRLRLKGAPWPSRVLATLAGLAGLAAAQAAIGAAIGGRTQMISWLPPWSPLFLFHQWRATVEGPLHVILPDWVILLSLVWWLLATWAAGRPERAAPEAAGRPIGGLLAGCLAAVLVLPHVLSVFHPLLFYGQRYMIISVPAFLLLTAWPAARSRRPRLQVLFLLLCFAPSAAYYADYYAHRQKRAWDTAAEKCAEYVGPGGMVWHWTPKGDWPLVYYLDKKKLQMVERENLEDFPPPPAAIKRLAIVSLTPALLDAKVPEGFVRGPAGIIETHWANHVIFVRFFERVPQVKLP